MTMAGRIFMNPVDDGSVGRAIVADGSGGDIVSANFGLITHMQIGQIAKALIVNDFDFIIRSRANLNFKMIVWLTRFSTTIFP